MRKYLFAILFCVILTLPDESSAKSEDYGINDLANVKMSYRHEGGHSSTKYVQVVIQGDGKATCALQYHNQPEHVREVFLDKGFIEDIIKQYESLDFFNYDFNKITESSEGERIIYDAGTTTFTYQYGDKARSIDYEIVKTKILGQLAMPINADAKKLVQLQDTYWRIISQETYLLDLMDYQKKDAGTLANFISGLGADAREKRLLNPKAFVPIIIEIISDPKLHDPLCQYTAEALGEITGEKLPGQWYDCEKWLKWWEANKAQYEKN